MDIENTVVHGQAGIEFTDRTGTPCSLWVLFNTKDLRFDLDTDFSQFSQEDIKALLPYLQAYANNGTLELQSKPAAKSKTTTTRSSTTVRTTRSR